jgi:hypothetical protein
MLPATIQDLNGNDLTIEVSRFGDLSTTPRPRPLSRKGRGEKELKAEEGCEVGTGNPLRPA